MDDFCTEKDRKRKELNQCTITSGSTLLTAHNWPIEITDLIISKM